MPYEDEKAGLAAIRAIAESGIVDDFRDQLADRHSGVLPELPPFEAFSEGTPRTHVLAIDGSNVYEPIPGALPCTEAGMVSLGVVIIDTAKLKTLPGLPESGAVDPRELQTTEKGETLGTMLPGRNAAKKDGVSPRTWFREIINNVLEKATLGGESFADTLHALLKEERQIRNCPNPDCSEQNLQLPGPGDSLICPTCQGPIWLADGLRIHEQFIEYQEVGECHARFRDVLEILALVNALRHLAKSELGRQAIGNAAFVMDGPLAAFGTIAVLAKAVREEFRRIQKVLIENSSDSTLLVMSGIKTGPFVEHAAELDRAPEPGRRIPPNQVWLPDNDYIRKHIVAGTSKHSKPWGELTYFGRPVILKTANGQRLVLNLAQPEADPPLTEASRPTVLDDAIATAGPLGVGAHQFLPLRRVHAQAAIPLRAGTDLIKSLAP